jgi:phosphoesterase RecJ-like protein
MRIAADLLEYDFDHAEVLRLLFDTESLNNIKLKGYIMNNIESYGNGKIQLIWTDEEILSKFGVDENNAADLVNIPRSVKGCEIAVELKKRKGKIRISLRANRVDVSEIAKHFGGGGHKLAAGAEIQADTIDEAKKLVITECLRKLGEL